MRRRDGWRIRDLPKPTNDLPKRDLPKDLGNKKPGPCEPGSVTLATGADTITFQEERLNAHGRSRRGTMHDREHSA